jgi:hypothetical protein
MNQSVFRWATLAGATLLLVVFPAMVPPSFAAQLRNLVDPTFSREVAPIFYDNCVNCHRPGEMAPMSLVTFDQARPWARSIREQVLLGAMPPWHADAPSGTFVNERILTDEDRATIVSWVDNGAPEGSPADLPDVPAFASGWTIGPPDAVVAIPAEFEVPARGEIDYQHFQVSTDFSEDKWVQAIEIRPSAPSVVHHILVYSRAPDGDRPAQAFRNVNPQPEISRRDRQARRADQESSLPQISGPFSAQPRDMGVLIATTAPGTNALVFPQGRAMRIKAGSILTFQVHYTASGETTSDQSKVGFVFADAPPQQEVHSGAFLNAGFVIPAGEPNHRVDSAIEFVRDVHVTAIFPHTHLRGKSWEYRLVYPDGRSEIVLSMPQYDFNWQTYYQFAEALAVPAGSRLEAIAHFDNSGSNSANPDPTVDVFWGQQTWEEMQYTGITYVEDDPGGGR